MGPAALQRFSGSSSVDEWIGERDKYRPTKLLRIPRRSTRTMWAFCVLPFPLYIVCTPCRTCGGGDRERRGKATRKSTQPLDKNSAALSLFPNGVPRAKDVLFHPITLGSSLLSHVAIWHWKWQPPPLAATRWRAHSQFLSKAICAECPINVVALAQDFCSWRVGLCFGQGGGRLGCSPFLVPRGTVGPLPDSLKPAVDNHL